jgi:histidine ammonia-lyase
MITLNGNNLTLEDFVQVARNHELVEIDEAAKSSIHEAQAYVSKIVSTGKPVYGINTGFGKLSDHSIKQEEASLLQLNLLRSHACGMGDVLSIEVVRGMMVQRINALVKGYSGIRLSTLEKMVEFLNKGLTPVVFEQGSLGASGDLALLSHMSLPLLGEGECFYKGIRMSSINALKEAQIEPLTHLEAKEGLSLINGTQAMNSIGGLVLYDAMKLIKLANLSLSLSMEALEGVIDAFDERVHQLRGQIGQINVAQEIRELLKGSLNITHQGQQRVQDAYSLRCSPQVHGAIKDTLDYVLRIVQTEMNAVTDNPLVFAKDESVISAGNFHGEPLAFAFDFLGIALSELANISERRIERLVNPALSNGLPPFLSKCSGINSGFMIVQYTAASLVSENKVPSHPASVDSIPSSGNQEDHVSMGSISARKAKTILKNVQRVIALEILSACQALEFRGKDRCAEKTKKAFECVRRQIPFVCDDELMYPHLHKAEELITSGELFHCVF